MQKVNNTTLIKEANRFLVLSAIMDEGSLTIEDIVRQTSLSRPTVLSIIKLLTEERLILKSGFAEAEVGRQPALYKLNTQSHYAIGIDLDFPPVRLAVSDIAGNIVYSHCWELPKDTPGEDIAESLVSHIQKAIAHTGLDTEAVIGIGLGVPAVHDIRQNSSGRIARIRGWENIKIDELIFERTGITVYVRNDAQLMGLIEKKLMRRDNGSFLYVVHRMGIGMATFMEGKLYEGEYGNSGHLGHTVINYDGDECECGNVGCLEIYCSKRAIVNSYNDQAAQAGRKPCGRFGELLRMADDGDALAIDILSHAGRIFGIGIANAIKLYDISNVIIGDLHCSKDNPFFDSVVRSIGTQTSMSGIEPVNVSLGTLHEESFGLGGCYFVIDKFFAEPKLRIRI